MMMVYQSSGITLYHGNCMEIMPQLQQVDHTITDPPYDQKTHNGAITCSEKLGKFGVDQFAPLADINFVVNNVLRLSRYWVLIFCPVESLGKISNTYPINYIRGGIWERISHAPQFSGDRPAQAVEGIAILHSIGKRMKWNGGGKGALWRHRINIGHKQHPTEKPLKLMTELISQFTNPGDTILDPFAGSGTTLRAAKDLGRKAIGIEINKAYCDIAIRRLSQEVLPIF